MIKVDGFDAKFWTFPGGERSVKLIETCYAIQDDYIITCDYKSSDDAMDLVLTVNALRHINNLPMHLSIPYFPFSRQDRVMTEGETFGLQVFADILKMCNFTGITTWDIHSDVAAGMFPAGVFSNIPQEEIWQKQINKLKAEFGNVAIISPDAGALKKIYKVASATELPVVEAKKVRDVATGKITSTEIDYSKLVGFDAVIIVDDICDYGRTFLELAKVIRNGNFTGKIILCVTHGILGGGLDSFEGMIDQIYVKNLMNPEIDLVKFNSKSI
jgi:ribose-phosphate pyrophosphokinase